ncbi:MAG: hypothetical protein JW908_12345 [Anaerolineales bacterium]|nr:hypothetical protein [Anaerolineales bacterium]
MAETDFDQLLDKLIPFAQDMISKYGEFFPFGSSIDADGQIDLSAPFEHNNCPTSQLIIDIMTNTFRKRASNGKIRAAGICYDVRTIPPGRNKKTDAIWVSLENQSGEAVDMIVPYKKGIFGNYSFGELFTAERAPQVFV